MTDQPVSAWGRCLRRFVSVKVQLLSWFLGALAGWTVAGLWRPLGSVVGIVVYALVAVACALNDSDHVPEPTFDRRSEE